MPRLEKTSRRLVALAIRCAAVAASAHSGELVAQFAPTGQFAPPATPFPLLRDFVGGEWVNQETELIEPILWIPGAGAVPDLLAVCNEPDDRVVFLDANLNVLAEVFVGAGPASLAKNPGAAELWVSVRNQASVVVIDLATFAVAGIARHDWKPKEVGIGRSASPGGIAFAHGRAFVAATQSDELLVFSAAAPYEFKSAVALSALHHGAPVRLNDPFAVTSFAGRIWVTSHLSGNNTISRIAGGIDLEDGNDTPSTADDVGAGALGPDDVSIVKLGVGALSGLSLPDFDVAAVDPSTLAVTGMARGVGTVLFDVEGNPQSNRLVVTNLEARNAEFTGESSFPDGRVAFNRFTTVSTTTLKVVGAPALTELLAGGSSIVMPTDVEISSTGRMFVAGYCSSNVGVWDPAGVFQGAIPTESGPRGVTLAAASSRLYVLNRGANSVQWFDVSNPSTVPSAPGRTAALRDPTPTRVKAGRQEFLKPNSALDTANCATCHVDARFDGIAWNLSKTLAEDTSGLPPADFRDRKGVMITQSLAQLEAAAPLHWRGEQADVESFNGAFSGLLKGDELGDVELLDLKEYLMSIRLPPNPRQPLNRMLSAGAAPGQVPFFDRCVACHLLPLGTSGDLTLNLIGDEQGPLDAFPEVDPFATKTAQLRGLWLRGSDECDIDRSGAEERVRVTGYGLVHEGIVDDLDQFLDEFFPDLEGHDSVRDFVDQLDSGLAPATLFSELLDASTANTPRARAIEQFLLVQADHGWCDAAARGVLDEGAGLAAVGLVWRRATATAPGFFATDDDGPAPLTYTFAQLEQKAATGQARLLFVGAPVGSGERIGVDRDRDGLFDRDEVQAGTNPAVADSDLDGMWDGYDLQPTVKGAGAPTGAPSLIPGSVRLVLATTNAIKLTYETDQLSPTIVRFGTSPTSLPWTAGDGLQPTGTGTTTHWRRFHTVVLGPQPLASPPLDRLDAGTLYWIRIDTQGQNGATLVTGPVVSQADVGWLLGTALQTMDNNLLPGGQGTGVTFHASALEFTNNGPGATAGTFDYAVRATFAITFNATGAPVSLAGLAVPGRFTLYTPTGGYTTVALQSTIALDVATGSWIADFAIDDQPAPGHGTGEEVTFDLPMWIEIPQPGGGTLKVDFPTKLDDKGTPTDPTDDLLLKGDWSDSISHKATKAN
jgi:DNA-binding beta-propeller fold protein YncE